MLTAIVFISGTVLMSFEIAGSRILAPTFGNSIFVWGSLISVFLAALSLGYYSGGRIADKRPNYLTLAGLVAAPGALLMAVPFYSPAANEWILGMDIGPRAGPLASSILLFFVPSVFMGMVSPYAIKLAASSLANLGKTAGRLYAISTVGSIAGTLLTSFFLVPSLGVTRIVFVLGGTLLLASLLAIPAARREAPGPRSPRIGPRTWAVLLLSAALIVMAATYVAPRLLAGTQPKVLFEKDSRYHHIVVKDHGSVRYLHFDNSFQSAMDLEQPDEMMFDYTRYLHIGFVFNPEAQTALFIGLGGGSAPKRFRRDYPGLRVDVAELDPDVVKVARDYFSVHESGRLRVNAQDGRQFVRQTDRSYDIAFLDAYFADAIPFHLTTAEFLRELRSRMNPNGVVVANIIGALSGSRSRLFRSMYKTYMAVFPNVYIFPVDSHTGTGDTLVQNIILVATVSDEKLGPEEFREQFEGLARKGKLLIDTQGWETSYVEGKIDTGDVPLLTDDFAPVDTLQHL